MSTQDHSTEDGSAEKPSAAKAAEAENQSGKDSPDQLTESLNAQIDKLKKDYLYLKAEFDTHKRNSIKERADLLKFGAERFLSDIIGVLDIFEQALKTDVSADNIKSFVQGIHMTSTELKKALEKSNVEELDPVGEAFDPTFHEAVTSEESHEVPSGHVVRVFKKGYKLHDRIVRPAQVIVAKEPSKK